ncbi:mitochondrial cardiolipin hydrolase [Nilaparvata lugens]|uniref:mitochondrial cardiolipin hydrolase n=1 Tax=Nilaparvata lugens TaxID=108931 RepID=UPI00193EB698|nr:mitochondrial cardiolipin hydrolase [Nilaparvata lugens]
MDTQTLKYGLAVCIILTTVITRSAYFWSRRMFLTCAECPHIKMPYCGWQIPHGTTSANDQQRLLDIIGQTKNTLDICIYIFTYQELYQKLIDLFDSGVKIRIIMDNEMSSTNGSKLEQLLEKGVDVRLRDPQKVMHHKFFIIDNSLLVTGSLNWTRAALVANTEQVLITNKKDFIDKSAGTFKILWDDTNTIQFPVETT